MQAAPRSLPTDVSVELHILGLEKQQAGPLGWQAPSKIADSQSDLVSILQYVNRRGLIKALSTF
jgi:hypothetical protein